MGMIKCPDCGKEISEAAISCIGCGRPMKSETESHAGAIDSSVYSLIVFILGLLWAYFCTMAIIGQAANSLNPVVLIVLFPIVAFPLFWAVRMAKKAHGKMSKANRNTAIPTIVKVGGYIGLGILGALWLLLINLKWVVDLYRGYKF